jgi:hypothetical protein
LGGALFFWQNASGINAVNYCKFPSETSTRLVTI